MRHGWWIVLAVVLMVGPAVAEEPEGDGAAVREAVTRAYIEGIHKEGDAEKIRSGFHPEFVMFVKGEDGVSKVTRDEWIARIEQSQSQQPDAPRPEIRHEFSLVERNGPALVPRIDPNSHA